MSATCCTSCMELNRALQLRGYISRGSSPSRGEQLEAVQKLSSMMQQHILKLEGEQLSKLLAIVKKMELYLNGAAPLFPDPRPPRVYLGKRTHSQSEETSTQSIHQYALDVTAIYREYDSLLSLARSTMSFFRDLYVECGCRVNPVLENPFTPDNFVPSGSYSFSTKP